MSITVTESVKHDDLNEKNDLNTLSKSREPDWVKVLFQIQLIISALCSIHFILYDSQWKTIFFALVLIIFGHIGVAAGAHRLWAHQSYTANPILRFFLMMCQTLSGTGSIYSWVQWHRLHHKYFKTDLDPFNPSKGWIFSHILSNGLCLSPAQQKELEKLDMSDIETDKIVMWQKKYYVILYLIVALLLPINTPAEYWGESLLTSTFILGWFRYFVSLNLSWLITSSSLIWGLKKGEKYPCDTNLVFIINKSNWLSYHYLAPWDYKTSEFGQYSNDFISKLIDVFQIMECASNLKTIDSDTVRKALINSVVQKRNITECLSELCDYTTQKPKFY
ncbi:acyl-CoA Delta-9 desaturase [Diorhabda sublineata]|uniref:acyl-CoA Delta-9 desaturase n=1 Tax=Diorhabda sublineata TaxID=1163346 RepID=UPI0024E0A849|nr:acyl-CoA Delta-9 desaturase [Diorhabda sublineata]